MYSRTIQVGDFRMIVESRFGGGNRVIPAADDGYLGASVATPDNLHLTVEVNPRILCIGVIMTGGVQKVMRDSPFQLEGGFMIFRRNIQIFHKGEDGSDFTKPGQNDIRFAILSTDGSVEYYQAGLVVQSGNLFLVCQQKGKGHFYRNGGGRIGCTGIRDELVGLLLKCFGEKYIEQWLLPTEKSVSDTPLPESKDPNTGVVNWYDDVRQTGMLDVFDGEEKPYKPVAVSWKACPPRGANGRQYLTAGEVVRFGELRPRGDTRSTIKEEVASVTIVQEVPVASVLAPRQATTPTS